MIKAVESLGGNGDSGAVTTDSVADVLERELDNLIKKWLAAVEKEPSLTHIPLSYVARTGHLPHLLHEVIRRLRLKAPMRSAISKAAADHGDLRHKQGYTVAMVVEESRLLQVTIFTTLHIHMKNLDFNTLLPDVVVIADEVDSQLKDQMMRFMETDSVKKAERE